MSGESFQFLKSERKSFAPALSGAFLRVPHVQRTFSRYRDASRSLRVPASRRSRHGLDWLNFFVADMQTGYGSFVAFYLGGMGWSQSAIGFALSTDNFLAVLGQIPGGALADSTARKRSLAA